MHPAFVETVDKDLSDADIAQRIAPGSPPKQERIIDERSLLLPYPRQTAPSFRASHSSERTIERPLRFLGYSKNLVGTLQ